MSETESSYGKTFPSAVDWSRLQLVFESAPNPIFILNEEGILLFSNKAGIEDIPLLAPPLGETHFQDLITEEYRKAFQLLWRKVKRGREVSSSVVIAMENRREELNYLNIRILPLSSPTEPALYVVQAERAAAGREIPIENLSRLRFWSLLENASEVVMLLNAGGKFIYVNKGLSTKTGFLEEDYIGHFASEHVESEYLPALMEAFAHSKKAHGQMVRVELGVKTSNGGRLLLDCNGVNLLDDSNISCFVVNARDVTEERLAAKEQEFLTTMLQNLFVASADSFLLADHQTRKVLQFNPSAGRLFGSLEIGQLSPLDDVRYLLNSTLQPTTKSLLIERGEDVQEEIMFTPEQDQIMWGQVTTKLLTLDQRLYEFIRIIDITQKKILQEKLLLDQQKQHLHVQQTPLGYIEWNLNFEVLEWNAAAEKIFGYSKAEALGKHAEFIIPTSIQPEIIEQLWRDLIDRKGGVRSSNSNVRKGGTSIFCEWYNTPLVNSNGKVIGVSSLVQDVTEATLNQKRIESSLKEKEVLISEIHHRVKNNLAVVSGLLFLQAESVEDEQVKQMFNESVGRIKSMALIHEKLYKFDSLDGIQVKEYFHNLAQAVIQTGNPPGIKITLELESDDSVLNMNTAMNCGLLLNELMTNSLKYAFVGRREGMIGVSFSSTEGRCTFRYLDNGMGFNPHRSQQTHSIGMELIEALSSQLNASIGFSGVNGVRYTFTFET